VERTSWRDEGRAIAVIAAATAFACRGLLTGTFPARDTAFTLVTMQHLQGALLDGRDWTRGPLAWPLDGSVAQTDWVLGQALLALPLRLLGLDPAVTHDATVVLGLFFTAWACHKLAEALLGSGPHTWIAGIAGGLNPVQMAHAQHTNLVWHAPTVLGGLLLALGLHRRAPATAFAGGLVLGLGGHFGFYVAQHDALVAACVLLVFVAAGFQPPAGRALGTGIAGSIAGFATLIPPALVWKAFSDRWDVGVPLQELHDGSWQLATTLAPLSGPLHAPLQMLWPVPGGPRNAWMNPPNPGFVALILAIRGGLEARRHAGEAAPLVLIGGVSLLLALGPDLILSDPNGVAPAPYRLWMLLPGAAGLREPGRWLAVAFFALSPLVAAGAKGLRTGWIAAAMVVFLLELPPLRTFPWEAVRLEPAYAALDDVHAEGALWDEALRRDGKCGVKGGHAIRAQLFHQRPLVGGVWARRFEELDRINKIAGSWPSEDALALFRELGVAVTLEHPPLPAMDVSGAECTETAGHRVCVIGDFGAPWPRTGGVRDSWDLGSTAR
jgi:hypothetical protein